MDTSEDKSCALALSIKAWPRPSVLPTKSRLTRLLPDQCPRRETDFVSHTGHEFHSVVFRRAKRRVIRDSLLARESRGTFARVTYPGRVLLIFSIAITVVAGGACANSAATQMSSSEKKAIADSLKRMVVRAYDLSRPNAVASLMSLYPQTGRVISASGGVTTTTRPELEQGIKAFWTYVGQNMKQPRWEWTSMTVDVLAPDAAAMTSTYRVPHLTPMGMPHVIGGAWTAVFQKRDGRWVIIQEHLSDIQSNPNPAVDSAIQHTH